MKGPQEMLIAVNFLGWSPGTRGTDHLKGNAERFLVATCFCGNSVPSKHDEAHGTRDPNFFQAVLRLPKTSVDFETE